ncbi:MAG: hypothetical protein ACRDUA_14815 [Micromonosporaceae bacterium]
MTSPDTPDDEPLILPVGHYAGAFHHTVGSPGHHHNVMIGAQVLRLDDERFAVWLLARGLPDKITTTRWTRRMVEREAVAAGVTDVPQVLAGLMADGLLVETIPGTEHSLDFAESYRLIPLLLGLGNSADEPWLHGIGFFNQPRLAVTSEVYSLWEWSHLDPDLWAACRAHAQTSQRAGLTDPEQVVPERILTGFLGALHPLLTAGAAYLDVALLDTAEQPA